MVFSVTPKAARTPKEVAQASDILLTSLPKPSVVEQVLTGPNGAIEGAKAGDIFIDLSTIDPITIRRIGAVAKEKGISVVDAPVTGGVTGATARTLTIMVGGEQDALEKAQTVLETLGKTIIRVGGPGAGTVTKLINSLVGASFMIALSEGLVLGVKAGVDLKLLQQVLGVGVARGYMFDRNIPRILKGEYEATFTLDMACKDLQLALDMARAFSVPLFLGGTTYEMMGCARNTGLGSKDMCAVTQFLEKVSDFTLPILKGE
jgi:3-hydroxyisobutyrate dehydrogenase-like beta-hydroxyacid dehydrogenase